MEYILSFPNPLTHFVHVKQIIKTMGGEPVYLAIPTWRPGRYEAANFAKNIRGFQIHDADGKPMPYQKISHSTWKVDQKTPGKITVTYEYFAYKMDAGNSWVDASMIYLNFINCLAYVKNRQNESCEVTLNLPENFRISCGLNTVNNAFFAKDYYELVDSPLIASPDLEHFSYDVFDKKFNIWIQGKHNLNRDQLLRDFQLFSEYQVETMGSFPEATYHFQLILLPYKFYHGVEHHDSTVICLGPGEAVGGTDLYSQLLGVSSHELFHAWNIIKIRPKELLPYDFNEAPFFPTGYVAEGFTTYYGDLFLIRSKVYDKNWYFNELNTLFRRHFLNEGRLNLSVVASSLDLWLDGYTPGVPHRKGSIYVEGAVVALMLDLMIRIKFHSKKSLDDVIRVLWKEFGQKTIGYSHQDIINVCEAVYGESLQRFFENFVDGTKRTEHLLNNLLNHFGCGLLEVDPETDLEKYFGIKTISENGRYYVVQTAPDSPGENYFSIEDEILSINHRDPFSERLHNDKQASFLIKRNQQEISFSLSPGEITYNKYYKIIELENASPEQRALLNAWLGQ